MGFETQEQAEQWAENAEFLADQRKEEKLLASATCCGEAPCQWLGHPCERKRVPTSKETLATIERSLEGGIVKAHDALQAAYALGKFDGSLEMAQVGQRMVEKLSPSR